LVLLAVLLVAAALRCYNINWDDGKLTHPDERSTVAFYATTMHLPKDWSTALDPRKSTFNPLWDLNSQQRRSYTYGHFPLYLLTITANLAHNLTPLAERVGASPETVQVLATANDSPGFAYVGRFLMAVADTFTVYLVYLIARRLYGQAAGLLAAAFSAFTVTQIQLAHFFAVDPISTTFTLLALYGAMLMVERRTRGVAALTGLGAGLAIASKFSALPIMAAPVVAVLIVAWQSRKTGPDWAQAVRHLLIAFVVAFLVFAMTSPFVLLDWRSFVQAVIEEQGAMASGRSDMPFTRQYRGTTPYLYHIVQQLRWGMGWPLGIVAFLGLGWVLVRTLLRRAKPGELILLSWIVPYFGVTGLFLAKFMRYMVPVVPLFVVMGAGMLVSGYWVLDTRYSRRISNIQYLIAGIVLLASILWSLAFVNGVYGTEHTWITTSRWIYEHVPDGSVLALEHWDDHLPLSLPEPGANMGAHGYRQVELPMYEDDNEQKYNLLRSRLREADYIVLSTNRLYGAIPRLPERYPMSTKYYQLLFAGELGFEKVAQFTSYPRLGPFVFNDSAADESFTVYDHPKPIIFQKVRELSDTEWDSLLGGSWDGAIQGYVGAPPPLARLWGATSRPSPPSSESKESKTLLLDQPVDQLPIIDDFRWNSLANRYHLFAVIFWWLAVVVVGLVAWPVTFVVFRHLSDRGYILAKSLGLIIVAYLVWISASLRLLRNSLFTIILALVLVALLSYYLFRRHKEAMMAFWHDQRRLIILNEALFAGAFLLFVVIRMFNPDLWQPWLGGEKPMEFAFLNAILKSPYFPPYDPYYAGGYINYYYYGQFIVGLVIKLTGVMPSVAFNLAIPMLFALTVGNAFCVGYNLARGTKGTEGTQGNSSDLHVISRSLVSGLVAAIFVAVLGNLDGMVHLVDRLSQLGGSGFRSSIPGLEGLVRVWPGLLKLMRGQPLPSLDYFARTRVIAGTINEFPYFSFLFADLHPHMIGIPFTILVVALALNIVLSASNVKRETSNGKRQTANVQYPISNIQSFDYAQDRPRTSILQLLITSLCLGALAVINTWDLPTYLGLIAVAFLLRERLAHGKWKLAWPAIRTVVVGGLSLLLYRSFFAHYKALYVGLGLAITRGRTTLGSFLTVWGFFLFIVITFLLVELVRQRERMGVLRLVRLVLARWEALPHLAELYKALVHRQTSNYLLALYSLGGVLLLAVALAALKFWVLAFVLPLIVGALLLLLRDDASPEDLFVSLLVFTGLLVAAGCEVVYLKDHLGGDQIWWRMNTVFKFYIQVWVMLGIAAAVALPHLWARLKHWQSVGWRRAWIAGLAFLSFAALLYPIVYTPARVNDRFPGARPPVGTLDGMAFMTVGSYTWPENNRIELRYDYAALRWLIANVKGTPVVAEAALPYYREGGLRVATYTGLPTLLGAHQNEQRYGSQVGERDGQARDFFNTPDISHALDLIHELHISYIYVGQLEQAVYDPAGLAKFDGMVQRGELEVVYENERTRIYRVRG
jgi:YYY domain-containing protein